MEFGARLEGLEPPAHGLEGRCSIQLSYRRMPAGRFPTVPWRIVQRNASVSADRYALYHRTVPVSTDFSPLRIDKTTYAGYAMRVRGEQTVAGLRA